MSITAILTLVQTILSIVGEALTAHAQANPATASPAAAAIGAATTAAAVGLDKHQRTIAQLKAAQAAAPAPNAPAIAAAAPITG